MTVTINRTEDKSIATNGNRLGNAKAETVAQKRKRLLVARQEAAATADKAKKAHQKSLGNPTPAGLREEKAAVAMQESTGKLGLNYVLSKAQKKTLATEREKLEKKLSAMPNKRKLSGFILNPDTVIHRAKLTENKTAEKLSLSASLPTGQTK